MAKKYSDYKPDELNALPYAQVLAIRQKAYAEHVAAMPVDEEIAAWAERMTAKHGPKVKVWENVIDWLTALLIVRWGEAPEHWPAEFEADDRSRALSWEAGGRQATGVTYLGGEM